MLPVTLITPAGNASCVGLIWADKAAQDSKDVVIRVAFIAIPFFAPF